MTNSSVTLCHHWSEQTGATATGFGVLTTRMPACPWCVIEQLHAAVKTAQELAATRLMDVGRLTRERHEYKIWWERDSTSLGKALNEVSSLRAGNEQFRAQIVQLTRDMSALQSQWDDMQQGFVEVFGEPVRDAIELLGATERLRSAHEPCERHRWKPGMWNVYYVRSDGQERPALSAETAEGAANALRQDAADLVRVIESEGASRDASSTGSSLPPTQHVAGGWGYSCTEAVRCSHGKVDGECLVIPCAHYGQKT